MAYCPVSNMVIPKNKVTSGVAWHPVSHGVSPKGVTCSKFGSSVNWGIRVISSLFYFIFSKNF